MILLAIVLAIVALAAAGITGWMIAQRSRSTAQRDQSSLLAATEQRATAAEVRVADLVEQAARRDAVLAKIHHEAANARQAIGSLEASLAASQQTATQHEQASRNAQRALAEAHRALSEATAAQAKVRGELGVVQERLAQRGTIVEYVVTAELGPPHDRTFEVRACTSESPTIGSGSRCARSSRISSKRCGRVLASGSFRFASPRACRGWCRCGP